MKKATRLAVEHAARAVRPRPPPLRSAAQCYVRPCGAAANARAMSSANPPGQSGIPKGLNTTNPFEIKFHVEDLPEDAAEELAGIESCFFEDEIEKFHSEMIGVFGSEPEEHDESGGNHPPPSSRERRDTSLPAHTVVVPKATPLSHTASSVRQAHPVAQPLPSRRTTPGLATPGNPSIKLIQGPCTYIHDGWIGSKNRWSASEVETMADNIAQTNGLHIVQHHSNHEGQILDWLLTTQPGDKIILNWNGRLADSPIVYRALSSIRAFVVVLAPLDVELGPLPPSVKGVITGFGTRSLELAIQACK